MIKIGICLTSARERLDLLEFNAYPLGFGASRAHADFNSLSRIMEQGFGVAIVGRGVERFENWGRNDDGSQY